MSKFFDGLKVLFAKIYNPLPPKAKIALMVMGSTVISGIVNLVIRDLTNYNQAITNDYLKLLIDALIPVLAAIINVVQEALRLAGTKILASEGDVATIDNLKESIAEKKVLVASSK